MFSIGEFSKITSLTVKTLRFYHEQGVLEPSHVDPQTGYRYYAESKVEQARIIAQLRQFDFTLSDIAQILGGYDDEADILDHLERHRQAVRERLRERLREYRAIDDSLGRIITQEREARAMKDATVQVEEKVVDALLIAGVRMKGRYSDCGRGFMLALSPLSHAD